MTDREPISVIAEPQGHILCDHGLTVSAYALYCSECGPLGESSPDTVHLDGEAHMIEHGIFPIRPLID